MDCRSRIDVSRSFMAARRDTVTAQFKRAWPFSLGLAKVQIWHDDWCCYIDKSGRVVSENIEASPW